MTRVQFDINLLTLKDQLFYFALSLTADQDKANDLIQETFLKALAYRDKFVTDMNFSGWVFTIMKNSFINNYRRGAKEKELFKNNSVGYYDSTSMIKSYFTTYSGSEYDFNYIHMIINALEDEFRIPLNMFLEGYKYQEISKKLNIPLGTVKSRIFLSRKKILAILTKDDFLK